MKLISLSPSKLNLFRECPRCFWDAYSGDCPRPRGIMPSLPGGMDLIMKRYVDQYRGKLPPGLEGQIPGVLYENADRMRRWRFWKTGPSWQDTAKGITLVGALDDCLLDSEFFIPLDWKTKGSEPKDDGSQYYQTQLDCYNLMLEASGCKVRDEGWLVYVWPKGAEDDREGEILHQSILVEFGLTPFKLNCSRDRAREIVYKAAECLRGSRPKISGTPEKPCEHCDHIEAKKLVEKDYQ